jgi:hypothetical protein
MNAIVTSAKGLTVLFGLQKDRIAGLAAVAAALLLGAWLCSLALG